MKSLLIIVFILFSNLLFCQTNYDYIEMKKGFVMQGHILDFVKDDSIKYRLQSGNVIMIHMKDIKKLYQDSMNLSKKYLSLKSSELRKINKIYTSIRIKFMPGSDFSSNYTVGHAFNFAVGTNLNNNLAIGLQTGLDFFGNNSNDSYFIPCFIEGLYNFGKNSTGHFLRIATGYAWKDNREVSSYNGPNFKYENSGGFGANLAYGMRLSNSISIEGGYRIQHNNLSWQYNPENKGVNKERYNRWTIGLHFNL